MPVSPTPPRQHVVWIHPAAPAKPAVGAPCNGCGVCCLAAPCPAGIVVSRRGSGPCAALRWSDARQRYDCGLLTDPQGATGLAGPPWLLRAVVAWARRAIAAGVGCDARVDVAAADAGADANAGASAAPKGPPHGPR